MSDQNMEREMTPFTVKVINDLYEIRRLSRIVSQRVADYPMEGIFDEVITDKNIYRLIVAIDPIVDGIHDALKVLGLGFMDRYTKKECGTATTPESPPVIQISTPKVCRSCGNPTESHEYCDRCIGAYLYLCVGEEMDEIIEQMRLQSAISEST
jgi:hypothetical protein